MDPDFQLAITRDLGKQITNTEQRLEVLYGARGMAMTQAKDAGATDDQLADAAGTVSSETVEHAQRFAGGSMLVRNPHPDIERIFPVAEWIRAEQHLGGKVYRRRIVVLEDWAEVEGADRG